MYIYTVILIIIMLTPKSCSMTTRPGSSVISTQVVLPLGINTSISMELIEQSLKDATAIFRFTTSEVCILSAGSSFTID